MKTALQRLALPGVLAASALAVAQEPRVYTPDAAAKPNEITVLNTTIASVDRASQAITVRVDSPTRDGRVDRSRTRRFALAERGLLALESLREGTPVLLTLRGDTVIDVRITTASPGAGATVPSGTGTISTDDTEITVGPGGATVTTGAGAIPAPTTTGTVVEGAADPDAAASPAASPAGPTRAPVTPVTVATPQPVATPRPVILPSTPPTAFPEIEEQLQSPPPTPPAPSR